MKKFAILFIYIGILYSCSNDDDCSSDLELMGEWQLIETYIDPGDGSGTFRKVESNKTVTFHSDGTITSNGSLCDVSIEADEPSTGTYSLENSKFKPDDCSYPSDWENDFEQNGGFLTLAYLCFEPCVEKYRKVCSSNN